MKTDRTLLLVAVIGSLVFLNIIGLKTFGRLDLTSNQQYTLGDATKEALRQLTDPITIKAYFSKDVPPPFSTNARYVEDLLEEYYAHADGYLSYEFVDPMEEETEEDKEKKKDIKRDIFGRAVREKTSVETELERLGIPPVQVQAREEDKLEVKKAYMGLAITYGENHEVIPVIKDTSTLEYDLTSLIKKLTRAKTPKVAVVTARSDFNPAEKMSRVYSLLTQLYSVTSLDMSSTTEIGDDVDALVILGNGTYSEAAKQSIDAFVQSGRSVAFLVDNVSTDLATLQAEPVSHGLSDLLEKYGVKVLDGLVLDTQCATMTVQQQRGFMRINQPVRYPFIPVAKSLDESHVLTRGLAEVAIPFAAPLEVTVPQGSEVRAQVLAKSSAESWVQTYPYNLDPFQRWTQDMVTDQKPRDILVALTGPIPSAYGDPVTGGGADARVMVAGGSTFVMDQFMSPPNQALALNVVDWLVLDQGLLSMRTRGLGAAPLDPELGEGTRLAVKWINVAGLPLCFIGFGLARWRYREARRAKVKL